MNISIFESMNNFEFIIVNIQFIVSIIVIYLLRYNTPYLWAFIIGSGINLFLNQLLKMGIKEKRPTQSPIHESDTDQYGMPSGHAQIVFFAITFYYLIKQHTTITCLFLFLACITLYQRYAYKYHTPEQLGVGAIIGSAFAYFIVNGMRNYLSKRQFLLI